MKTILIVDDESGFAEALGSILSDDGYRVFVAANGREGLDRLPEVQPHLIVLDLMMPVLSGPATLDILRDDPATASIPVLMVSAAEEDAVREYTTRYDLFLRKPFGVGDLMRAINTLIGDGSP